MPTIEIELPIFNTLCSKLVERCHKSKTDCQLLGNCRDLGYNNLAPKIVLKVPKIGTCMLVSQIRVRRSVAESLLLILVTEIKFDNNWDPSPCY